MPTITRHPAISEDADTPYRARDLAPGDLILVHSHGRLAPRLIGFGQRLHHPPEFAYWTHVAVYVGHGRVIEAKGGSRVRYRQLEQYDVRDYAAVRLDSTFTQRRAALHFLTCQLGKRYEYAAVASIGLWALLGGTRITFGGTRRWFCSDLGATSAEFCGTVWDTPPLTIMPADIAEHFGIRRS